VEQEKSGEQDQIQNDQDQIQNDNDEDRFLTLEGNQIRHQQGGIWMELLEHD
jgi:hypothetical protein